MQFLHSNKKEHDIYYVNHVSLRNVKIFTKNSGTVKHFPILDWFDLRVGINNNHDYKSCKERL